MDGEMLVYVRKGGEVVSLVKMLQERKICTEDLFSIPLGEHRRRGIVVCKIKDCLCPFFIRERRASACVVFWDKGTSLRW